LLIETGLAGRLVSKALAGLDFIQPEMFKGGLG
jgi:hypothetical protein